jgi:hypothetical protein
MSAQEKYLKYKLKYFTLKKLIGGSKINFSNNESIVTNIEKILRELSKPLLICDYIYWKNQYGGLCIQDFKNYKAQNNKNKICISVKIYDDGRLAAKITYIIDVYIEENVSIKSIPAEFYSRINMVNEYIDDYIAVRIAVIDELKNIIKQHINGANPYDTIDSEKKRYINGYNLLFKSKSEIGLINGIFVITKDNFKIEVNYIMGKGQHFIECTIIKSTILDNHELLRKLREIK